MDMYEIVALFAALYFFLAIFVYAKAAGRRNAFWIAALWLPLGLLIFVVVFGTALLNSWDIFKAGMDDV